MRTRTIFYVNVGNLPKGKVKEYLEHIRNDFGSQLSKIDGDEIIYLPVRDGESRVEVFIYPES